MENYFCLGFKLRHYLFGFIIFGNTYCVWPYYFDATISVIHYTYICDYLFHKYHRYIHRVAIGTALEIAVEWGVLLDAGKAKSQRCLGIRLYRDKSKNSSWQRGLDGEERRM